MTHAESRFFKDLGKEINPRAFSVSEEFDSKLTILRKRTCKGTNWGTNWGSNSLMSTMSAMVVGEVKPADDEILIQDDYYI